MTPGPHRAGQPAGREPPMRAREGRRRGRRGRCLAVAFLSPLILAGCGDDDAEPSPSGEAPLQLEDAEGRVLALSRPPDRIVSLVPSGTQTLVALGAGDLLVGRTDFDTASSLASLPSVGGGLQPSLERLLSLEPDLVIRFAGESDPGTPARLQEVGIPVFSIRPDRVADVRRIVEQLGLLSNRTRAARRLLDSMDATLARVREHVGDRVPVRAAYLLGGSPPWVAGGKSYIGELLTAAGAVNAFGDMDVLYAPVSQEELLVRPIDLLLAPEGADLRLPGLGIPLQRVSPDLEMPGPDLAERALELARLLHPEAFR